MPPCLWGDDPALEPMPVASGVRMMIKAITNSTYEQCVPTSLLLLLLLLLPLLAGWAAVSCTVSAIPYSSRGQRKREGERETKKGGGKRWG